MRRLHYLSSVAVPSRSASSIHAMKMCAAFAAEGADVTLFATPGEADDPFARYGVGRPFALRPVGRPAVRGVGALVYAARVRRASRRAGVPDVYHARTVYPLAAVASLGRPLVLHVHSVPANAVQARVEGWLFRHPGFERLVCVSHALAAEYRRRFPHLAADRVVVAPNGTDALEPTEGTPSRDAEAPAWPGRLGHFQLGYVGHLYPGRGVDVMAGVARCLPDVDVHLIGGRDEDVAAWREREPLPNLHLHGFVAPADLDTRYRHLDAVAAPYQRRVSMADGHGDTARWMSPMKLFDYMARRLPIIASDLPAIAEVVADERTALLVPPDDVAAWAAAVERLRADAGLGRRLAEAAYERAHDFTWRARARRASGLAPSSRPASAGAVPPHRD